MKGIQFIIDDTGEKTAVVIDLKQWGELWAKFYNILQTNSNDNEAWLHQSPLKEKLEQALEWAGNNPPETSDLEALERKLNSYE